MLQRLLKPEYLFQPRQLWRRLTSRGAAASGLVRVVVPGGCSIDISPSDDIGQAILCLGVFDLVVTETLWRLSDPGETAIDAGANIGYMTAVLASRVGSGGSVWSFEPHPQLFAELAANVDLFRRQCPATNFVLRQSALSDQASTLQLNSFDEREVNRGISRVVENSSMRTIPITAVRLDDVINTSMLLGVMKVDVEGHEMSLFRGAERLFVERRLRDIVFEEHREYPTDVTTFLESHGMSVLRLGRRLFGPELLPADSRLPRSSWEATSFLATFDPSRALARMMPRKWRCLIE